MRPNLGRVVCGGCVATPAMTVLMYTLAPAMGVQMDIAALLGSMLGGWKMGMLLHILNGVVVFPLIYALLLYRFFLGPPLLRGISFGVVLWFVSQLVVMPLMGAGLFSSHVGGTMAVLASLAGHIIYGSLLGLLSGPAGESLSAPEQSVPKTAQGGMFSGRCETNAFPVHLVEKMAGKRVP